MGEIDKQPSLRPAEKIEFSCYPEGDATLEAICTENISDDDLRRIVEICNQDAVFGEIANHATGGEPYELKHARQFLEIGDSGWKNGTNFMYIIRDGSQNIVAAMDIKSNNSVAEVGYWADESSPGYITNGLAALGAAAKQAGFSGLVGMTRTDNDRSANVFRRLGWDESVIHDDERNREMFRFSTNLE